MRAAAPARLEPRLLSNGHAAPILVADFQPFSASARLSDLISAKARDSPVYQLDPLVCLSQRDTYLTLADIAGEYAAAFEVADPVSSEFCVVGYCSAAALALHIARLLAGTRKAVTILVRPVWPDTALVHRQFAQFRTELGSRHHARPDLNCDPGQVIKEMEGMLRADLSALAAERGVRQTNPAFTVLLKRYRAWLSFLLAIRNDLPLPWALDERVCVFAGTSEPVVIPWGGASDCEVTRLTSLDAEPLVSPDLAGAVLALAVSGDADGVLRDARDR